MDELSMDSEITALEPNSYQRQLQSFDRRKIRTLSGRSERGQVLVEALVLLGLMTLFFIFILNLAEQQKQNLKRHRFSQEIHYAKNLA